MGTDLDNWIEKVQKSEYLSEDELKSLCEFVSGHELFDDCWREVLFLRLIRLRNISCQVKEILVEESNVQPVNSPVTVSTTFLDLFPAPTRPCSAPSPRAPPSLSAGLW